MNKTITNKMIRKALRQKDVEKAVAILGGTEVFDVIPESSHELSEQGFVMLLHRDTGVKFVVSKDRAGYSALFGPYSYLSDYDGFKKYDFINKIAVALDRGKLRSERNRLMNKQSLTERYRDAKHEIDYRTHSIKRSEERIAELEAKIKQELEDIKTDESVITRERNKQVEVMSEARPTEYAIELFNTTTNEQVDIYKIDEIDDAIRSGKLLSQYETDTYSYILHEVVKDGLNHIFESSDGNEFKEALKNENLY